MSQYGNGFHKSFRAAATLSAYRVVSPDTAGSESHVRLIQIPTQTSLILGISQASATTDLAVDVVGLGYSKVAAGASVSAGAILTFVTSTGYVIEGTAQYDTTTTAVPRQIGIALGTGIATDAILEAFVMPVLVRKLASA